MKCHNCGKEAHHEDKFCMECGAPLSRNTEHTSATVHHAPKEHFSKPDEEQAPSLPAEQAEVIVKKAKHMIAHLSNEEKIIGGASLVALIAYFLPWYSSFEQVDNGFTLARFSSWLYIIPILLIISLALVYFSQGAKTHTKIYYSTIQAIVGAFAFTMVVTKLDVYTQFGAYLIVISSLALSGYSLYYQKKILSKK